MGFNLKQYAQQLEQNEELIPEIEPQQEIPEVIEENIPAENQKFVTPSISEQEPPILNDSPQQTDREISEIIANGVVDVSQVFNHLINQYGLDDLSSIIGNQKSQQILNNLINQTVSKIQQKLGN